VHGHVSTPVLPLTQERARCWRVRKWPEMNIVRFVRGGVVLAMRCGCRCGAADEECW
jgi:hypothetical protein